MKFVLFVYILTSPFLLEKSGVTGDEGKKAVASAAACLLGALGLGIIVYDRDRNASARALGALLILSWLSTIIVIWRHRPPASSLSQPWLFEGLAVSDEGTGGNAGTVGNGGNAAPSVPRTPETTPPGDGRGPGSYRGAPVESQDPWPPGEPGSPGRAHAEARAQDEPWAGGRETLPEWASGDLGDGLSPDGLGRIFGAPTLKEFMNPSPSGFVTPSDLDEIQSGAVGQPGSALQAIVPLGSGSFSAQGVMLGSDVCGAHGFS